MLRSFHHLKDAHSSFRSCPPLHQRFAHLWQKPAPVDSLRRLTPLLQIDSLAPANWPEAGGPLQALASCSPAPEFSRDVRHIVRRLSLRLAGQIQPAPAGNVVNPISLFGTLGSGAN